MVSSPVNITLLAGGVGGAKMAEGFASIEKVNLSIIGNIGDDEIFHGLLVSPDIDTLAYTLSGLVNKSQGWGVKNDTYRSLSTLSLLGNETWMSLGDSDFGLHMYRTERLNNGERLSDIVKDVAKAFKIKPKILIPTDDRVQTRVKTKNGWISFQEYFVREKCKPKVLSLKYQGIEKASPTKEALEALENADLIVLAPSNPLLSIAPILEIKGIKDKLKRCNAPIISISPLIAGKAIKGPTVEIMKSLGLKTNSIGVAELYKDFVDAMVIDKKDKDLNKEILKMGINVKNFNIYMRDIEEKKLLAKNVIQYAKSLISYE